MFHTKPSLLETTMPDPERTILVIDDESDVVDLVCYNLEKAGYKTLKALEGVGGLSMAKLERPDAIILDLMLPGMNGYQVFEALKQDSRTKDIPVIMVTAKAEVSDRIRGLKAGVDDYVTKPFSPKELVLRVASILKWQQSPEEEDTKLESGPYFLDRSNLRCYCSGELINLTSTEFKLLATLIEQSGELVLREELFERVWGKEDATSRTLDTHVMRLREKLGKEAHLIQNVRGKGYRYDVPDVDIEK